MSVQGLSRQPPAWGPLTRTSRGERGRGKSRKGRDLPRQLLSNHWTGLTQAGYSQATI
jgi:hypothetical protein